MNNPSEAHDFINQMLSEAELMHQDESVQESPQAASSAPEDDAGSFPSLVPQPGSSNTSAIKTARQLNLILVFFMSTSVLSSLLIIYNFEGLVNGEFVKFP